MARRYPEALGLEHRQLAGHALRQGGQGIDDVVDEHAHFQRVDGFQLACNGCAHGFLPVFELRDRPA